MARWEPFFARRRGHDEPYLDCDEAANILGEYLYRKKQPFNWVLGKSDEGSSHLWVQVGGIDYDPTDQGCNPRLKGGD